MPSTSSTKKEAKAIEADILELQRRMLANYRTMQTELRALVDKERFLILKKRLDNMLQSAEKPKDDKGRSDEAITLVSLIIPKASEDSIPMIRPTTALFAALFAFATPAFAQEKDKKDPVFSGPQVGEKLPGFKVKGVFGDAAGKELDFVKQADGKPIVLVFVHDVNRMSLGMTRTLTTYTASRAKDGLHTGVVWLADDVTEAENTLKRVGHALAKDAPLGISPDGKEGPGSYGLNRTVMLTILVGKESKVTANFALVQPSLQADLPKILDEVVKVAGGKAPKVGRPDRRR